jgi:hypothetical protein
MLVYMFLRRQQMRRLVVLHPLELGYSPRLRVFWKGPVWRYMKTKNGSTSKGLMQKGKLKWNIREYSSKNDQKDKLFFPNSNSNDSQFIKKNDSLREERTQNFSQTSSFDDNSPKNDVSGS